MDWYHLLSNIICCLSGWLVATLYYFIFKYKTYMCEGSIIMYENEMYLALTKEDKEAFKHNNHVRLKLVREKFHGFNET